MLHRGNINKMQLVPLMYSLLGGRQIIRVHYNEKIPSEKAQKGTGLFMPNCGGKIFREKKVQE